MERRVETGWLLDFYGPLLTERQRTLLRMYCEEDLSLAEIAAQESISRQGVHDAVKRGDAQLRAYEEQLGLLQRYRRLYGALNRCREALEGAQVPPTHQRALARAREALREVADEEGFDGF